MQFIHINHFWRKVPNLVDNIFRTCCHKLNLLPTCQCPINHTHQYHNPQIRIIPRIDQQRARRRIFIPMWCGQFIYNFFQQFWHTIAGFTRYRQSIPCVQSNHICNLFTCTCNITGRQINLVQHRQHFQIIIQRQIRICQRLCLNPLGCVNQHQRAFARGQRPRHFV